jgi:transposase
MRILFHETTWKCRRIGTATHLGCRSRPFRLYTSGSCRFSRGTTCFRDAMDDDVPRAGASGVEGQTAPWPCTQTHRGAGAGSSFLVFPIAQGVRLDHRTVERTTCGDTDPPHLPRKISPALCQPVAGTTADHATKTDAASPRAERAGNPPLDSRGVAADKKSAQRRRAHLVLIDESGFLMSPLVRRTLAPRGKTPLLKTKGSHRDKVSLVAALSISPKRHRLGLYWRSYPREFVNSQRAAAFLRYVLQHLQGKVIVVWDGGSMHKGEPIAQLLKDFPRLSLEKLPPYAPDLNPVEFLWNHLKYGRLANYAPDTVLELDAVLQKYLKRAKHSAKRLHSFCESCALPFY